MRTPSSKTAPSSRTAPSDLRAENVDLRPSGEGGAGIGEAGGEEVEVADSKKGDGGGSDGDDSGGGNGDGDGGEDGDDGSDEAGGEKGGEKNDGEQDGDGEKGDEGGPQHDKVLAAATWPAIDTSEMESKSFIKLAVITKQLTDAGLDSDAECKHPKLKGDKLSNSSVAVFEREIVALL
eukprot:4174503-Pleurochrysis_carterae.AAC.1